MRDAPYTESKFLFHFGDLMIEELKHNKNIKELNKTIIDEFIEKIYIGTLNKETNTREIRIEWNLDL